MWVNLTSCLHNRVAGRSGAEIYPLSLFNSALSREAGVTFCSTHSPHREGNPMGRPECLVQLGIKPGIKSWSVTQ